MESVFVYMRYALAACAGLATLMSNPAATALEVTSVVNLRPPETVRRLSARQLDASVSDLDRAPSVRVRIRCKIVSKSVEFRAICL